MVLSIRIIYVVQRHSLQPDVLVLGEICDVSLLLLTSMVTLKPYFFYILDLIFNDLQIAL